VSPATALTFGMHEADVDRAAPWRDPFIALSFLALPVIPALRLTDRGLVDVERFRFVPLFGED
jgi:adenine deaminase